MRSASNIRIFVVVLGAMALTACPSGSSSNGPPNGDDTGVLDDTSIDDSSSSTDTSGDTATNGDTIAPPTDTRPPPDGTTGCGDDMQCGPADYCPSTTKTCTKLPSAVCSGTKAGGCPGVRPECKDESCFEPGYCTSDADCHAGEHCGSSSLCVPTSPCAETVSTLDVANGKYAAGKEVCVRDVVHSVIAEADGDYHVRLGKFTTVVIGTCPFPVTPPGNGLVTEITPEYQAAGVTIPSVGATIEVHGKVRWDGAHCWWEVHPVEYWK